VKDNGVKQSEREKYKERRDKRKTKDEGPRITLPDDEEEEDEDDESAFSARCTISPNLSISSVRWVFSVMRIS
jgi:hypothetical protein